MRVPRYNKIDTTNMLRDEILQVLGNHSWFHKQHSSWYMIVRMSDNFYTVKYFKVR